MERRTFSIMFFFRRTKLRKNLEAPVLMCLTVNGERTDVSIQRTILPERWDSQRGCSKSTTRFGKELNQCLDQIRLRIYQCHQELLSRNLPVTSASLKTAYLHGIEEEEVHSKLPNAKLIIDRYRSNQECQRKGVLLPVLSNQKVNAYLKEIADLCGIQKNLTTHCARHTFATTVTLANHISMESVS